ncbi:sigma-70 family RNA polymerase sigma factor [Pedobacter sp.]|uniref:sigma-70 family RNA polymerase sigma factor n=1 Tax=Pedobacter sp. TaxID=1411316 RepID=UPI003C5735E6
MKVEIKQSKPDDIVKSWVKLYTKSLYSWALFKLSHKESAEDLVQDTFLTAHQQLITFRGDSSARTWLFGILNNKITEHYRKQYRSPIDGNLGTGNGDIDFSQFFDSNDRWKKNEKPQYWEIDEGSLLDNTEFNQILLSCLNKLPNLPREAIQLQYIEQKKGPIICQELNITQTNLWQILHRAKLQLRKCLEITWFNV